MTVDDLTRAYLSKAGLRFEALKFYLDRGGYSDVVREAQELVELLLKAVLRAVGVEVPKVHDVRPVTGVEPRDLAQGDRGKPGRDQEDLKTAEEGAGTELLWR